MFIISVIVTFTIVAGISADVPLLLFSNQRNQLKGEDVNEVTDDSFWNLVMGKQRVVMFVRPHLETHELAGQMELSRLVKKSPTFSVHRAVSIPLVIGEQNRHRDFESVDWHVLGLSGQTHVVSLPNGTINDDVNLMKEAYRKLSEVPGGFVVGYTGRNAGNDLVKAKEPREGFSPRRLMVTTSNGCPREYPLKHGNWCFSHYVMFTPQILGALSIGFLLIFGMLIGVYAIDGIQTATKFALSAPPYGKEY